MRDDTLAEARRQAEICNACRYCEGYCAVFPALQRDRAFTDGALIQLANLCHNCRGCYYACQYTAPHEFAVNLPATLARVRRTSWQDCAWPRGLGQVFHRSGMALGAGLVIGFALVFALMRMLGQTGGNGFYDALSHAVMVAVFLPAFLFPAVSFGIGVRRYWRAIDGGAVRWADVTGAFRAAATMRNLSGGHGEGCNFEDEDRFSTARKHAHHALMYGFLLCFGATAAGTILHYGFDAPAPYGPLSLPKLLGVPGGVLMTIGAAGMLALRARADRALGDTAAHGGETAFVWLLLIVALSGLALYWLGSTAAMPALLALHLGSVLAFFVLSPFSKMAHGVYRMAALVAEATRARG